MRPGLGAVLEDAYSHPYPSVASSHRASLVCGRLWRLTVSPDETEGSFSQYHKKHRDSRSQRASAPFIDVLRPTFIFTSLTMVDSTTEDAYDIGEATPVRYVWSG